MNMGFIVESEEHEGLMGVFEDDDETGYLYLYRFDSGIERELFIYKCGSLEIEQHEVEVLWSRDHAHVGVKILGELRGIIEIARVADLRVPFPYRDAPGIVSHEWLRGFE
jgi:hypothetical protein